MPIVAHEAIEISPRDDFICDIMLLIADAMSSQDEVSSQQLAERIADLATHRCQPQVSGMTENLREQFIRYLNSNVPGYTDTVYGFYLKRLVSPAVRPVAERLLFDLRQYDDPFAVLDNFDTQLTVFLHRIRAIRRGFETFVAETSRDEIR